MTLYVEEKLSLCQGLSEDVTFFSTCDVFVEEVNCKVVTRSRKCHYAVTTEQKVCKECHRLSKEKIVERYVLFSKLYSHPLEQQFQTRGYVRNLKGYARFSSVLD